MVYVLVVLPMVHVVLPGLVSSIFHLPLTSLFGLKCLKLCLLHIHCLFHAENSLRMTFMAAVSWWISHDLGSCLAGSLGGACESPCTFRLSWPMLSSFFRKQIALQERTQSTGVIFFPLWFVMLKQYKKPSRNSKERKHCWAGKGLAMSPSLWPVALVNCFSQWNDILKGPRVTCFPEVALL